MTPEDREVLELEARAEEVRSRSRLNAGVVFEPRRLAERRRRGGIEILAIFALVAAADVAVDLAPVPAVWRLGVIGLGLLVTFSVAAWVATRGSR